MDSTKPTPKAPPAATDRTAAAAEPPVDPGILRELATVLRASFEERKAEIEAVKAGLIPPPERVDSRVVVGELIAMRQVISEANAGNTDRREDWTRIVYPTPEAFERAWRERYAKLEAEGYFERLFADDDPGAPE